MFIKFDYEIEEKVNVTPLAPQVGVIVAARWDGAMVAYLVAYWSNGNREVEWLMEGEISHLNGGMKK